MRDHNCALANYCDRYVRNSCQGCSRLEARYPITESMIPDFNQQIDRAIKKAREAVDRMTANRTRTSTKKKETVPMVPEIKNVYFNKPMTIVIWADGTKTMVKCQKGDKYSKETGLAVAIAKKAFGTNKSGSNFNEVFKKWIPEYGVENKKPMRKKKSVADGKEETK